MIYGYMLSKSGVRKSLTFEHISRAASLQKTDISMGRNRRKMEVVGLEPTQIRNGEGRYEN